MMDLSTGAALIPADEVDDAETRRYAIGLDVGGTKVRGVVTDAAGEIIAGALARTRVTAGGVLDTIAEVVASLLAQASIEITDVAAVGLGIPGVVDPLAGVVTHAVNLGIDEPFDIVDAIGVRLGCSDRVYVENDVNAAALGIAHALGLDNSSAAVISSGTGLAAGLVINGRLWRGASGVAGEIGHISIDAGGPLCKCGQRGCLELYASGSAIARLGPDGGGAVSVKRLFSQAGEGDQRAQSIVATLAASLAVAVRLVTLAVDPEKVILMGGVANVGRPLLDAVRSAIQEDAALSPFLASLRMDDRVVLAPDLPDLPARGAARLRA